MHEHRAPRNTVADRFVAMVPRGIEEQEKGGQRSFVASDTLPTEWSGDGRAQLEAAGVVFYAPVSDDPLFTFVTLPSGWRKVDTPHPLWSHLVDETGKQRAALFYKAAFYDRAAKGHVVREEVTDA